MRGHTVTLHTGVCIALGPALLGNRCPTEARTELSLSTFACAPALQPVTDALAPQCAYGSTRAPAFDSHGSFLLCSFVESTRVRFAPFTDETIRLYVDTGEWRYPDYLLLSLILLVPTLYTYCITSTSILAYFILVKKVHY